MKLSSTIAAISLVMLAGCSKGGPAPSNTTANQPAANAPGSSPGGGLLGFGGSGTSAPTGVGQPMAPPAASGSPPKPQPGSWSMRMELVDAQGPDAERLKAAMQPTFDAMSKMSVCITPEASQRADPARDVAKGNGNCTFDRKDVSATGIHFSGTCNKNGAVSRVSADGMVGATSQDMTIRTEAPSPRGGTLSMVMRVQSQRTGECKPGDITPPPAPAAM